VSISLEVGDDTPPLDAIRGITECLHGIESGLKANVARARSAGHSWQEIADALGVSRQSAWERFAESDEEERLRVIHDVMGSLKGPGRTTDEVRRQLREEEAETEERKWGESPPGLKWR
jgi:predicted transcriptional regulator